MIYIYVMTLLNIQNLLILPAVGDAGHSDDVNFRLTIN